MTFVSFNFYIFLSVIVFAYYLVPQKLRWTTLLLGSLFFYFYISAYSTFKLSILVLSAFLCWLFANLQRKDYKRKNIWFFLALATNALPLLLIKEAPFFFSRSNATVPEWLIAPIGFSFYSMQLIAYTVDIYHKKATPESNFAKFLLFVSFFPQIIQGPIPRYNQLAPQLVTGHRFDEKKFVKGFMLILWGFFLKLCIADKAAVIVNAVFDQFPTYQGTYVLVAGILYSFQLYADFLACTSFAQGTAELVGIELINNFQRPYFSKSVKEFWRRWHISLSSWLKDYIYIPLGGNKKGTLRKYLNLLLTFAVSGIWHGAGYKFIFWGLIHGVYQIIGKLMLPITQFFSKKLHLHEHPHCKAACQRLFTFALVTLAWIIFRADHLSTGLSMILSIFTVPNLWILTNDALFNLGLEWKEFVMLIFCFLVLLSVSVLQEKGIAIREKVLQAHLIIRWAIYIGTILFIMLFGTYGYGFNAQAFIYGGF